mmetsp:Transcript_15137/g.30677  ORF Transcript_15137/g.30677 Transcript_15137/m.30677 type:complete len:81 (+) Transcript_15137:273-515(+)
MAPRSHGDVGVRGDSKMELGQAGAKAKVTPSQQGRSSQVLLAANHRRERMETDALPSLPLYLFHHCPFFVKAPSLSIAEN